MVKTGKQCLFNGFCEQRKEKKATTKIQTYLTLQCKEKSNSEEQLGFGNTAFADGTLGDKHNLDKHLGDAQDRKSYLNEMYFIELCFYYQVASKSSWKRQIEVLLKWWKQNVLPPLVEQPRDLKLEDSSALAVQTWSCWAVMHRNTLWEMQ